MADLIVPPLGESITEAVVGRWLKNVGDAVAADENVLELETDKITVQLPAPVAGALSEQRAAVGSTVKVGEVLGQVAAGAKGSAAAPKAATVAAAPAAAASAAAKPATASSNGAASPAKTAAASVATTSAGSALNRDALLKLPPSQRQVARHNNALPAATSKVASAAPEAPLQVDERDEVIEMSPLRKRIAERLVQAQHETASLTTFNEVDMTAVMELRARFKDSFEKQHGVKLGFMSFFVKACVEASRLFPGVNAEVHGSKIIYKHHYDFGVAVSTPKGLVVPVLRDADALSFAEIEGGIGQLAEKARTGKLAMEDLIGGTFSITNGGIYGSMMSTPLLNFPQTGILGMHNIVKRAVVIGDEVKVRSMMYLALTYDHRVVDGKEAVSFLVAVKERIEQPERLLLSV
ncbi:MAG: 2-oxoglutarate dehydrogenase complex dihydrolipoyllysine-residue succinyltransferase [Myxococcales bacterium]|nr:2-oxoglutarate dehydrogenase complex dihydrolipoyllysine-residue succinyltransferase [Myxococcales bacterium]